MIPAADYPAFLAGRGRRHQRPSLRVGRGPSDDDRRPLRCRGLPVCALAYALLGRDLTVQVAAVGIAVGTLLLTVTAAAMFPAPEVFAAALGCR